MLSPAAETPRLHGDLAVWLVVSAELFTFAILFVLFAVARLREPEVFRAGQATLALWPGAVNTVLLASGSACVALAVHAARSAQARRASCWLMGAIVCGLSFLGLKSAEYADKWEAGRALDSDTFWMFYVMLTGFHFLHVAVAVVLLALVAVPTRRGAYGPDRPQGAHTLESVGVFWHMVDLLWMVLFPLVYVLR